METSASREGQKCKQLLPAAAPSEALNWRVRDKWVKTLGSHWKSEHRMAGSSYPLPTGRRLEVYFLEILIQQSSGPWGPISPVGSKAVLKAGEHVGVCTPHGETFWPPAHWAPGRLVVNLGCSFQATFPSVLMF